MKLSYMPMFLGLLAPVYSIICSSERYGSSKNNVAERLSKIEQQNKNSLLLEAVTKLRIDDVKYLLADGADPNGDSQPGKSKIKVTPFSRALAKNDQQIIKLLKEHGGTLVAIFPDKYDFTNLYSTCDLLNFSSKKSEALYTELFQKKHDSCGRSWLYSLALGEEYRRDHYGPLWKKLVTKFCDNLTKKDLATRDIFGNPPLYYVRVSRNRRLQKIANTYRFDKTVENILGDSAEQFTRHTGPFGYHTPNLGIEVPEIGSQSLEDITQITRMFPDNFNFFDVEKVLRAVSYDTDKAFAILSCVFTDLNRHDASGNTLLHHIAFIHSYNYVCGQISELLKKLIKNGADPNKKNKYGCTPLHVASFKNKRCLVSTLLAEEADPLEKLTSGKRARDLTQDAEIRTALAYALLRQRKAYIADLLEKREQWLPKVVGELIADFEAQEVDETTGNIKISYD